MDKALKTFFVAATLPGALLLPYLNGALDGIVASAGFVLCRHGHPIVGGVMLAYAVISSTLTVALANRRG